MSKRDDAKVDYLIGKSYKEIAEKYGVSAATVRAWKSRYKWPDKLRATKCNKPNARQQNSATKTQHVATQQLIDNKELTEKQKLFCVYYLQRFNATWAYMKVYGKSYETSKVQASRLLTKPNIKKQIQELKRQTTNELIVDLMTLVKSDAKQAFADLGDYVNWETNNIKLTEDDGTPVLDENKKPIISHITDIYLTDKDKVDTSLIKSVSKGRDGLKIELKDTEKAKDRLFKFFNTDSNSGKNEMNGVAKLLSVITKGADKDDDKTK